MKCGALPVRNKTDIDEGVALLQKYTKRKISKLNSENFQRIHISRQRALHGDDFSRLYLLGWIRFRLGGNYDWWRLTS